MRNAGLSRAAALLLTVCAAAAAAQPRGVDGEPRTEGERALSAALDASARSSTRSVEALQAAAVSLAGSREGGLARLEIGLRLVDLGQAEAGLASLRHADVSRTALGSLAAFTAGRALETSGRTTEAVDAYLRAAVPGGDLCPSLLRAADLLAARGERDRAVAALDRAALECPGSRPHAMLEAARQLLPGHPREAAERLDQIDDEFPASVEAQRARTALAGLGKLAPTVPPEARFRRKLAIADALAASRKHRSAAAAYAAVPLGGATAEQRDTVRVRRARSLDAIGRKREAAALLGDVASTSPLAAEAAFLRVRTRAASDRVGGYEEVIAAFPESPWAEEALLALANHYTKDAREEEALPYWKRLAEAFPEGRYADRAAAKVGLAALRARRNVEAALVQTRVARARPDARSSAGLLYWAGRAHAAEGDMIRARALWQEAALRFRRTYHGQKAASALGGTLPVAAVARPAAPPADLTPELRARLRDLLLLRRFEQARDELAGPLGADGHATLARIERRLGNLRGALVAMKRAYPDWVSARAEDIPASAWQTMFPLEFGPELRAEAAERSLDPALVAALICQESTFDPRAVSQAGARGLMQVMPATGRSLARQAGVPYRRSILNDPAHSLDFGTRYLADMLARFGGRVERALAAYNAGPHRVEKWVAGRAEMSAEDFVESIPFTETRQYVMTILASAEEYRRIHGLLPASAGQLASAPEPR